MMDLSVTFIKNSPGTPIWRKKQQIEPLFFPTLNSRFERCARVNGRVVEDDQRWLLHSLAVVIKTLDQDLAIDRPLKDVGLERSVEVEKAQDVEPLRMSAWNFQGLSAKLPGVGHARDQTEAGPVEIDQVEITITNSAGGPQLVQMRFGGLKVLLISLAARGATHPFPDVIATLEQPFERVRTEHGAKFFSDSEDSGFQRSRVFKCQLQRFVFLTSSARIGGRPLRGSSANPSNL
jgi:hypothetical protein